MTIDIDAIRNRAYHAANNRHRWASEVGVTDVDVLDGLRRAKQLAVDDVPALLAKVDELTAELGKIADSIAPTVTVKPVSDAVWFLHGLYKDWAAKAHEQQAKVDELTAAQDRAAQRIDGLRDYILAALDSAADWLAADEMRNASIDLADALADLGHPVADEDEDEDEAAPRPVVTVELPAEAVAR